jgi:phosphatidylethanolamine/phosphatidyl-N-methylethanolamine N-methyltransferase
MPRPSTADRIALEARRVVKVYSVLARVYDDVFDWILGPGRRVAMERLPIGSGERVLEIGVGTGLTLPLYPRDCRLTGIDISEEMLEQAQQRAESLDSRDVDLRLMDACNLDFPDGTFDHVLAPYVISVLPEPRRVMEEARRVCRPGGTIAVLNHFHSPNAFMNRLESCLSPISQWVGFRMDVPSDIVTATPGLEVDSSEKVNVFGLWKLIVLRRD